MKTYRSTLLVLLFILVHPAYANGHGHGNPPPSGVDGFEGTWVKPDESTIPAGPAGDMIRYGRELLTNTYKTMGGGSDFMPPYSGNRLSCSNCHMNGGTMAYASPWSVVALKYADPGIYSSRTNEYRNRERRVNGCMQRSMNGIPLPEDGYEMRSIIAYFDWLATGIKVATWQEVKGQGYLPPLADMTRAADPQRGARIYMMQCMHCHQRNGRGVWDPVAEKYIYPAVAGPYSYNDGAGMYRIRTGVRFVYSNMPYGRADPSAAAVLGDTSSLLRPEDAWDVMAYVNSLDRPVFWNRENDWGNNPGPDGVPDWMKKAVDADYPIYYPRTNYADDYCAAPDTAYPQVFPKNLHKYGPWAEMLDLQQQIISAFKSNCL